MTLHGGLGLMAGDQNPKEQGAQGPVGRTEGEFLDAAERLFATNGYQGTTARAIADEAKGNLGSLHYYWGNKEGLFRAVCERRLRPLAEERLKLFDQCVADAAGGIPEIRSILEASILPVVRRVYLDGPNYFAELMARTVTDPSPEVRKVMRDLYDEAAYRYLRLLRQACSHLDDASFVMRFHAVMGTTQQLYTGRYRMNQITRGQYPEINLAEMAAEIIDFLVEGLQAPMRSQQKSNVINRSARQRNRGR